GTVMQIGRWILNWGIKVIRRCFFPFILTLIFPAISNAEKTPSNCNIDMLHKSKIEAVKKNSVLSDQESIIEAAYAAVDLADLYSHFCKDYEKAVSYLELSLSLHERAFPEEERAKGFYDWRCG